MRRVFLCLLSILMLHGLSDASNNIEDALRSYLKGRYPWSEIEIRNLAISGEIPEGVIKDIYVDKRPPGRIVFTVQYSNGKKILVTANVKAFDWVVMSRRPQGKGYLLKEDDLFRSLMDVTKIPRGAIKEIDEARGMSLRRSIIANSPLTQEMLAEGNIVKKGSRVLIVAESPAFTITATGELRENGYVGSLVRAINLSSRKTVRGILINENTLKVEF